VVHLLNKLVETGDFYTQTLVLVTYDTSGDAKLTTRPLRWLAISQRQQRKSTTNA